MVQEFNFWHKALTLVWFSKSIPHMSYTTDDLLQYPQEGTNDLLILFFKLPSQCIWKMPATWLTSPTCPAQCVLSPHHVTSILFVSLKWSHVPYPSVSPCQPPAPPSLSHVHFSQAKMCYYGLRRTPQWSCIAYILHQPCALHCHLYRINSECTCLPATQLASTHHLKTLIHWVLGVPHADTILFVSLKPSHAPQPPSQPMSATCSSFPAYQSALSPVT